MRLSLNIAPMTVAIAQTGAPATAPPGRRTRTPSPSGADPVGEGRRLLYGSLGELGVSLEWHDFQLAHDEAWSRGFHPATLALCLNLTGNASIRWGERLLAFGPLMAGFCLPGSGAVQTRRAGSQRHRFLTVEFTPGFLRWYLSRCDGALHPLVEAFMQGYRGAGLGEVRPLSTAQERSVTELAQPPVFQAARPLWYQGKVLEIMADFFFERRGEDELFCDRQKRVARERVERVMALLRQHLVEPLRLEALGRAVGCSPFHLSRTFSAETGMTLPQCLRRLRMERAAELLQSGKFNVTEAALEVGYSSLSHFSRSFCRVMGRCPGLYPLRNPIPESVPRARLAKVQPSAQSSAEESASAGGVDSPK